MSELATGDKAPDFTLPRNGGGTVSLSDFKGRKVVLYFYPKDNTQGCTTEALEFSALADSFAQRDTVIIGVSPDSVRSHDGFVSKHGLNLVLASDMEKKVCEAYAVWVEKSMYGRKYMGVERSTFLIGPDGRIVETWNKVKVAGHAEAVLAKAGEI